MCFKVNVLQFFLRLQISEFVSYVFADIDGMQMLAYSALGSMINKSRNQ